MIGCEVRQLTFSTLIIIGSGNHVALEKLWHWLKSNIKNSELLVSPADEGDSHELFIDNPKAFNQAVIVFLNT